MRIPLAIAALLVAAAGAQAQSTGGQTGGGSPATNPATPMQQMPAGTTPGSSAARMSDSEFVTAAASANKFEVLESELALQQGSDAEVKKFAELMIKDHKAALAELETVARAANVAVPPDRGPDASHQTKINALKNRRGAEFDQAYRTDQAQAHDQTATMLDTYAQTGSNSQLKAWAAKTLVVVRAHQKHLASSGPNGPSQ